MKISPYIWKLTLVLALLTESFFSVKTQDLKFVVPSDFSKTDHSSEIRSRQDQRSDAAVEANATDKKEENRESLLIPAADMSHSPSLAELPGGGLMVAWYAGSREGAKDVKIWFSIAGKDRKWQPPQVLLDKETLQKQTGRFIRKLGNPVIFTCGNKLHCWVVSVSYGGWSGSSLNHAVSEDGGKTWSPFHRMKTSPFFNISNLVRVPPVPMDNGKIGLPLYHEFILKYCQFLVLDAQGKILSRSLIPARDEALQPVVVAVDDRSAVALMRNGSRNKERRVFIARTQNAGKTWQMLPDLPLNNNDSSLGLTRNFEGDLFLVANSGQDRSSIELFHGSDKDFFHWTPILQLEKAANQEFSYPSLLIEHDGSLGLVYTWKRKGIKYQRFNGEDLINMKKE